MACGENTYGGDAEYAIACSGDCVIGDDVRFEQATFSGSWRRPKFDGFILVTARVVSESYGRDKQQHTFTLALPDGGKILIKGRNLYRNGTWRKLWESESARRAATEEKHGRGDRARRAREIRKEENELTR